MPRRPACRDAGSDPVTKKRSARARPGGYKVGLGGPGAAVQCGAGLRRMPDWCDMRISSREIYLNVPLCIIMEPTAVRTHRATRARAPRDTTNPRREYADARAAAAHATVATAGRLGVRPTQNHL